MRIGIDFDNTIVSYDNVFHRCALERCLIPSGLPVSKIAVRDYLQKLGRESDWRELQGHVYGPGMSHAEAFPGALERVAGWIAQDIPVFIVSFKMRHPYAGQPHDLHATAWAWLERQGFFERLQFRRDHVFFEETRENKLRRIETVNCTHFLDDLPEILSDAAFPADVARLLFDPNDTYAAESRFLRVRSWAELSLEARP